MKKETHEEGELAFKRNVMIHPLQGALSAFKGFFRTNKKLKEPPFFTESKATKKVRSEKFTGYCFTFDVFFHICKWEGLIRHVERTL